MGSKHIAIPILALVPALIWGQLCSDPFSVKTATQTLLSGSDPKNLTVHRTKQLNANLSDVDVLIPDMSYKMLIGFQGSCTKKANPMTFVEKPKAGNFARKTETKWLVQMYDSSTQLSGMKFEYWFGFFDPPDTTRVVGFVGRKKGEDVFKGTYISATLLDSVRDPTSGLWKAQGTPYYNQSGPLDSASAHAYIMTAPEIAAAVPNANHHYYLTLQFITLGYTNQALAIRDRARFQRSGLQVSHVGDMTLIRPGEAIKAGEPLYLYNMLGGQVATLHPTGYLYQWNGKHASGADAPAGVYFVQGGGRILGRFLHSPR